MKKVFVGMFLLLLMPLVLADECDSFCTEKGYDFGDCRLTTEEGFCGGNEDEDVFGFSQCEGLERCCCGNGSVAEEADNESATSSFNLPDFTMAQGLFWILLVVVVILGIGVYNKRKKKDDVFKELQP
jgi:hypothetical protein